MKKSFYRAAMLMTAIALFGAACKGHSGHNAQPELNINFSAAFIVNGTANNLSVLNLTTDVVEHTIDLNGATFPHHIYLSPDKKWVAVAITSTDLSAGHAGHGTATSGFKVLVIDAVKGTIVQTLELAKLPHNAVFSPNGLELWLGQADTTSGKVLVYKTADWTKFNEIAVGKNPSEVTFSADGSTVFVANTDDATVSLIDPTAKSVIKTLAVGQAPVGAWAAENGKMYVDNETSQTVSEINVATKTITATIALGYKPGYVAFNNKNSELWVTDATNGKAKWYKFENNAWTLKGEVATGADAHAIAISKDGNKVYVTNQGGNTLSILDAVNHSKIKDVAVGSKPNGIVLKQ